MRQDMLLHKLSELLTETREGKIRWSVDVETTEANAPEDKPTETEGGIDWTLDECYVSYDCLYRGEEFCMITYELIKTAGERVTTSNMVFLPPLGMRYFDLRTLLPYSVETSAVLLEEIHQLWVQLTDMYKADKGSLYLNVSPRVLTIEDE